MMKRMNQPVWAKLKGPKHINANTNDEVAAAMVDLDNEYEALCSSVLVSV